MKKLPNAKEVLAIPIGELVETLNEECRIEVPDFIQQPELTAYAGTLLARCTSLYSYLSSLSIMLKLYKRGLKAKHAEKDVIEDAMSREDVLKTYADIVKQTYSAISRMVTIKQQLNEELRLTGGSV